MIEPGNRPLDRLDCRDTRQFRPAQHDHGEAERARRCDLAVGRGPAAVLGDHDVDRMTGHQYSIVCFRVRSSPGHVDCMWYRERRLHRLYAANEIAVLRGQRKSSDVVPADCQEDAARQFAQRLHRLGDIRDQGPAVAVKRRPWWPSKREQRDAPRGRRRGRVGGNRRGIGMRRVDEGADALGSKIVCKAGAPAEAAGPHRHSMRRRRGGAPGKRNRHGKVGAPGKMLRQAPRFRRAAENEDALHAAR